MPRNNAQKEANESEIVFDREVWCAIRYLDPDRRKGDVAAAIAVLAIVGVLGTVIFYLR